MKKALINALCLAIALLSGISLFILKYQVKEEEKSLKTIHREILQNKREIHMLEAEWAHLNDPQRLMELVKSQTKWETISAKQISTLSDIPLRPEVLPAAPEVIETEKEAAAPDEKKVVQEVVPIAAKPVETEKKVETVKVEAKTAPVKAAAQPVKQGSVENGVWKPVAKQTLKTTVAVKPAAKPASVKSASKPIVKNNAVTPKDDPLKKGSSALSTLLKGGKR